MCVSACMRIYLYVCKTVPINDTCFIFFLENKLGMMRIIQRLSEYHTEFCEEDKIKTIIQMQSNHISF